MLGLGRIGDVQYCPYSRHGPLVQEPPMRVVTLFELMELVALAQTPQKYVLVVAGPCGRCGRTRTQALQPLLSVPSLAVWTHLVMDLETAQELVQAAAPVADLS